MKSPAELKTAAIEAIQHLVFLSNNGDFEAVEAMRDIGLHAADALAYPTSFGHSCQPDHQAVSIVSEHSHRWPISIPAIEELRDHVVKNEIPERLGEAILDARKRKGRGKTRQLDNINGTRLAYDVYLVLESRRSGQQCLKSTAAWAVAATNLPRLDHSTLGIWLDAGLSLVKSEYNSKSPTFFITPPDMLKAVFSRHRKEGVSIKSAFDYVVKLWLERGFTQLIGKVNPNT